MRRILVVMMLLLPVVARAQATVTVTLSPGGQALATSMGITPQQLADGIQTQINNAYDTAHVDNFLRSFADATSFSMRGLGVDYMSVPGNLILGVGAQVALATDGNISDAQRPTAGLAANVSVMAGLNLGDWGHPRWTVFANGFYRNGATEQLHGAITTAGAHLQYRLVDPQQDSGVEADFLRWTGIDITSGVEFTKWDFGANDTITTNFNVAGSSGSTALTLDSMGQFDLSSTATTVPVEITTGLRIALLLSLYIGAGFDFTVGKSTLDANLNGHVHAADGTDVGTVTVVGSGSNTASPGTGRALAGVQINLWKLKVFTQVNVSPTPAASIAFGVRLVL